MVGRRPSLLGWRPLASRLEAIAIIAVTCRSAWRPSLHLPRHGLNNLSIWSGEISSSSLPLLQSVPPGTWRWPGPLEQSNSAQAPETPTVQTDRNPQKPPEVSRKTTYRSSRKALLETVVSPKNGPRRGRVRVVKEYCRGVICRVLCALQVNSSTQGYSGYPHLKPGSLARMDLGICSF